MQGTPWSTVALSSLLMIAAWSKGGQEVQSPQPEKSTPPVTMAQHGRILGIGGVFFKSASREGIRYANGIRRILDSLTKAKAWRFLGANTTTRRRNT